MIRRALLPLGIAARRPFPTSRSDRRMPAALPAQRFSFRRSTAAAPRVVIRATAAVAPRLELVLAPRVAVNVARGGRAVAPLVAAAPAAAVPLVRDTLVLRERIERTIAQALRRGRRVEVGTPPPAAPTVVGHPPGDAARTVIPPSPPSPRAPLVFQQPASPAAPPEPRVEPARTGVNAPAPSARLEVDTLVDDVLRRFDRRVNAERERRGLI